MAKRQGVTHCYQNVRFRGDQQLGWLDAELLRYWPQVERVPIARNRISPRACARRVTPWEWSVFSQAWWYWRAIVAGNQAGHYGACLCMAWCCSIILSHTRRESAHMPLWQDHRSVSCLPRIAITHGVSILMITMRLTYSDCHSWQETCFIGWYFWRHPGEISYLGSFCVNSPPGISEGLFSETSRHQGASHSSRAWLELGSLWEKKLEPGECQDTKVLLAQTFQQDSFQEYFFLHKQKNRTRKSLFAAMTAYIMMSSWFFSSQWPGFNYWVIIINGSHFKTNV